MSGMGGSPRSSLGSTSPSSDERNSSYDSLDSPGHTGAALEAQALVFDTRLSPVARAPSTGTQQVGMVICPGLMSREAAIHLGRQCPSPFFFTKAA